MGGGKIDGGWRDGVCLTHWDLDSQYTDMKLKQPILVRMLAHALLLHTHHVLSMYSLTYTNAHTLRTVVYIC